MVFGTRLCESFTLSVNVLVKIMEKKKELWCAKKFKGYVVRSLTNFD